MNKEYRWYILRIRPRHEAVSSRALKGLGIESFVPTRKVIRRWSDRNKCLDEVLFPGYLFAWLSIRERDFVFRQSSVAGYLTEQGIPCYLTSQQMDAIRRLTSSGLSFDLQDRVVYPGARVLILEGPLTGIEAEVVKCNNRQELVLRLPCLNKNILVKPVNKFEFQLKERPAESYSLKMK